MNNEQNNNIFSNLNPTPSNQPIEQNTIPGANLSPVFSNDQPASVTPQPEAMPTVASNVTPVTPQPEVQTVSPITPNIPVQPIPSNNDTTMLSTNSEASGVINATPNSTTVPMSSQELKVESSNPFDIGIGPSTSNVDPEKTQIITPITPIDNNVNNGFNNQNSINNMNTVNSQAINNNLGNATPLSSESSNNISSDSDNIVSVSKYMLHMLLFAIPIVGFVMLLVKAFSKKENKNISNYAKAQLLFSIIITVIVVVVSVVFGTAIYTKITDEVTGQSNDYNYQYDYNYNY